MVWGKRHLQEDCGVRCRSEKDIRHLYGETCRQSFAWRQAPLKPEARVSPPSRHGLVDIFSKHHYGRWLRYINHKVGHVVVVGPFATLGRCRNEHKI